MIFKLSTLMTAMLTGTLLLTGCQQQTPVDNSQTTEPSSAKDNKAVVQSDSAKARIEQFQPLYVAEMESLQRRLQAEYDAFEAADTPNNNEITANAVDSATNSKVSTDVATTNPSEPPVALDPDVTKESGTINTEINTSTEVGERDLAVLKRVILEPQNPNVLTQRQLNKRYQQAIEALYQPVSAELSAQNIDTLINISTLIPQLFEHIEIAERVNIKSPALARLIVQHQVGQQIEAQQVLDIQQMKLTQQQEFEGLMTKFNETIKDYDEQIAKYEQTLKEFQ